MKVRGYKSILDPVPLLIIPIIMAHDESLINNTEDIVVAISHMAMGLCSVTILPLASTYVCHRRAAMTSSSCAHLALSAAYPSPSISDGCVCVCCVRCLVRLGEAHHTQLLLGTAEEEEY